MDADFWHERWQRGEIGFHQPRPHPALDEFWSTLGLAAGARVFVPLAGKSLDLLWLAERGFDVVGVELSAIAVQEFRAEHGSHARIELRCADLFDLEPGALGKIDAVFDRAALIALPPAMRVRYAAQLRALTAPGTRTLLVTMEYEQSQMRGPPHAVLPDEVRTLYGADHDIVDLGADHALADAERFAARGVTAVSERRYRLTRR